MKILEPGINKNDEPIECGCARCGALLIEVTAIIPIRNTMARTTNDSDGRLPVHSAGTTNRYSTAIRVE